VGIAHPEPALPATSLAGQIAAPNSYAKALPGGEDYVRFENACGQTAPSQTAAIRHTEQR